jgi:LacI family transcriptional regulator
VALKALSKPKVTIYDVARLAGVSIATVSRTLRGSDLVVPETRAKVLAAAEQLNFTPSRLGRSLAEGRHAANGIVFPDLVGPYYAEVVLGYEEAASKLGRSVIILTTHGRRDAAAQVQDLAGRVDGLVIMGRTVSDEVVADLARTGVPIVLLARDPVGELDTISAENEATAKMLTEHLLGHGHRRLAFLGSPAEAPDVAGRYRGFVSALGKAPAPTRCGFDVDAGHAAAQRLLKARARPDAIVCANDELALGVHLAATEAGLRIPTDVAVVGWDDVMAARFVGLTTARQPMRELGAAAARRLHERIANRLQDRDADAGTALRQVLPTQLVVRHSCGTHPLGGTT